MIRRIIQLSLLCTTGFFFIVAVLFLFGPNEHVGFDGTGGIFYNTTLEPLASISPIILPFMAAAAITSLVWKGDTVKKWRKNGHDYDIFKIMTKMRGSPTRIRILNSLELPKNKLQLANEMGLDWKSIDSHIKMLIKYDFVEEMATVGTATFYIMSEKGKNLLKLLANE